MFQFILGNKKIKNVIKRGIRNRNYGFGGKISGCVGSAVLAAALVISAVAAKGRAWQQREERMVGLQQEADWLVATTGQEVVRRGRCWGK